MLTADDGYKIAHKIGAKPEQGRKHVNVKVFLCGQFVGRYGIRRGSNEHAHDYIADQLGIPLRKAHDLASCPLTKEQLIKLLVDRGKIVKHK